MKDFQMYQEDSKLKYERHIFVCENQRDPKNDILGCCGLKHGAEIARQLKKKTADAGLKHKIRVNRAGCLGECAQGVVLVIYPEGIWLKNATLEDVDDIFEKYILQKA